MAFVEISRLLCTLITTLLHAFIVLRPLNNNNEDEDETGGKLPLHEYFICYLPHNDNK